MPLQLPRALILALTPLVYLTAIAVHLLVPLAVSLLAPRWGWSADYPGRWNLVGLAPIVAGVLGLVWACVTGLRRSAELPATIAVDWTPKFLLRSGPYAFSRNPIYVSELAMWLGCAILLGSAAVATSCVIIWSGQSVIVRREERDLAARFGDSYRAYLATVPRWIGRRLRTPPTS